MCQAADLHVPWNFPSPQSLRLGTLRERRINDEGLNEVEMNRKIDGRKETDKRK